MVRSLAGFSVRARVFPEFVGKFMVIITGTDTESQQHVFALDLRKGCKHAPGRRGGYADYGAIVEYGDGHALPRQSVSARCTDDSASHHYHVWAFHPQPLVETL